MSAARRSLLTATAAGTLLGALWFVPSANATGHNADRSADRSVSTSSVADTAQGSPDAATDGDPATHTDGSASDTAVSGQSSAAGDSGTADDGQVLADTGSVDTTPYLFGGTAFLGLGAAFVAYSIRRGRAEETA